MTRFHVQSTRDGDVTLWKGDEFKLTFVVSLSSEAAIEIAYAIMSVAGTQSADVRIQEIGEGLWKREHV